MSEQEQPSNPDPEYSPGGIIPFDRDLSDQDLVRILLDPSEKIITAEDMRRVWGGSLPEGDEGPVSE